MYEHLGLLPTLARRHKRRSAEILLLSHAYFANESYETALASFLCDTAGPGRGSSDGQMPWLGRAAVGIFHALVLK